MAQRKPRLGPFSAPAESARAVALRYQSDEGPGIRRRWAGQGFSYQGPDGTIIRDAETRKRIRSLAIPPAWTDVWISPLPNGHIQATGRDARGRKQYRYHPRWRQVRDATKYDRMRAFGEALPRIRRAVDADLAASGISRRKVLALIVELLEATFIRIGNEEYARANRSFGLTTLQNRHVEIAGHQLHFRFRGKSGKSHSIRHSDRRVARLVQRCRDLPGQDLFQYLDEAGEPQPIDSADVNAYIQEIAAQDFTAKDFRTWAGTVLAARELVPLPEEGDDAPGRSALVQAVARVAEQLGNTPAVCRKGYIHPAILTAFTDRAAYARWVAAVAAGGTVEGLTEEESAVLRYVSG